VHSCSGFNLQGGAGYAPSTGSTKPAGRYTLAVRAACFQFDVRSEDVGANREALERGSRLARERGAELVVLPEMWPTSFPSHAAMLAPQLERMLDENEAALEHARRLSAELDLLVCGSAFARGPALPTNRWHLFESGRLVAWHDKVHLFTPTAEDESFSPGDAPPAWADTRIGRVGGLVCYDLRFPELARVLFHAAVQLITVSAQWPSARAAHWRALLIGRAVESQCFVVACNRSGVAQIGRREKRLEFPGNSLIVDPDGNVLTEGRGGEELVLAELDFERARKLRIEVPIVKDERAELYRRWKLR
jgi:omega-amidase